MKFFSGLAERLRDGLGKTRAAFEDGFARIFQGQELEGDTVEDLESLLLQADLVCHSEHHLEALVEIVAIDVERLSDVEREGRVRIVHAE